MATALPYGDIVSVNTPAIDNAAALIYQKRQADEQKGYEEYQQLQKDLQKEFANVRSADTPEIYQKYNDIKTLRQKMLFDNKLKNNPSEYAKAVQDLQGKVSDFYTSTQASQETKERLKTEAAAALAHPELYTHDAITQIRNDANLPTSKIAAKTYTWGGGNFDFNKFINDNTGKYANGNIVDAGQTKTGVQKFYKSTEIVPPPTQIKESIYTSIGDDLNDPTSKGDALRWMAKTIKETKPEDFETIDKQFDALISDPMVQQAYGKTKEQLQITYNPNNLYEKEASYLAKKAFINNPPKFTDIKDKTDKEKAAALNLSNENSHAAYVKSIGGFSANQQTYNPVYSKLSNAIASNGGEISINDVGEDVASALISSLKGRMTDNLVTAALVGKNTPKIKADKNGNLTFHIFVGNDEKIYPITQQGLDLIANPASMDKNVLNAGGNAKQKTKTYNVIDPKTGAIILQGVSKEDADKAQSKGYKIQ